MMKETVKSLLIHPCQTTENQGTERRSIPDVGQTFLNGL